MNAERLHALVLKVSEELVRTRAVDLLAAISSALQQVVGGQVGPGQKRLGDAVTEFRNQMTESQVDTWSPAFLELLEEIGYRDFLGQKLLERVNQILASNEITPSLANEQIDAIRRRLEGLREACTAIKAGFETLSISSDTLVPGECEVGVLIPRIAVENDLGELADEFTEIEFIIRTAREIVTGETEQVIVRTISSSDFSVFIAEHAATAAFLAAMVERLLATYKNVLDVRKLHGELAAKMGKKTLKEVETYAEETMLSGIKKIADDCIKTYGKKDDPRKNELRNALDVVLRKLADRIDRGFNIEIRIEPLKQDDPTGDASDAERSAHRKYQAVIEGAAKQLEFFHRDGPPILHLDDKPPRKRTK